MDYHFQSSVYKTVGAFVLILVTMNFYSSWAHTSTQEATEFVGTIGVCITIATFASPLAQLVSEMKTYYVISS